MAMTIAKMSAVLGLNSKGFTTGLRKASKRAKSFAGGLAKSVGKIGAFGGAIAGVAGSAGIGALTSSAMTSMDAVSKMSDEFGASTKNLSGFGHAAAISGGSIKNLQKSMRVMSKSIGEVALGISNEGKVALDALGLSLTDLEGLTTDEQFLLIADEISKMGSSAHRSAAAMKIFGRGGLELMNMLMLGKAGIMELTEEADTLGVSFDRFSGAKVEAANDALTRLQAVFTGMGNSIAVELAPFIVELSNRIVAFTKEAGGMRKVVGDAFESIATKIAFGADVIGMIVGAFNVLRSGALFAIGGILKGIGFWMSGWNKLLGLFGVAVLNDATEFIHGFSDELLKEAKKIGSAGIDQVTEGFSEAGAKKVKKFFSELKADADAAAEVVVKTHVDGMRRTAEAALAPLEEKQEKKAAKETLALQGKASRLAFGAEDAIEKPIKGDPEQTQLLRNVVTAITGMRSVPST